MTDYPTEYLADPYPPVSTDKVLRAFPASIQHLMPAPEDIPEDFRHSGDTAWNDLASTMFYKGIPQDSEFHPRPGIDPETAYWHLYCILSSYWPKHEHKEAAVAFLASCWFEKVIFGTEGSEQKWP